MIITELDDISKVFYVKREASSMALRAINDKIQYKEMLLECYDKIWYELESQGSTESKTAFMVKCNVEIELTRLKQHHDKLTKEVLQYVR